MKIGYTLWTWLLDEHNEWKPVSQYPKRDFEQSLREIADLGYAAFENFNLVVDMYESCPQEFAALTRKYGLEFVNVYHYMKGDISAEMEMAERCCRFNNTHGAELINIEAPDVAVGATTAEDLDNLVRNLAEMGKLARRFGTVLCLHPHYGTTCFYEAEIDYILSRVEPALLSLCMDTAHTYLAGMDPAQAFKKYISRIRYVHLKDVDPELAKAADSPMRGITALGEGIIGFREVMNVLKAGGYDGYLTVECDFNRVCNYESAAVSRAYIHRVLGM